MKKNFVGQTIGSKLNTVEATSCKLPFEAGIDSSISSKGNTRRAGPVRQISVKEMIRKLEEKPGNSRNFKTDRKPQTPRKSQTGNKVKEFKRLTQ